MTTVPIAVPETGEDAPIRTFADILHALSRDPALAEALRQHILDDELRRLPAAFQRLAATVEEYMTQTNRILAELRAGQARHDADIAEVKAGQARLEEGQARHDADIAEVKAGQARLEEGQARHDADIAELKAGQARLEEGQARHDADIAELKAGQARLEEGQARHDADIAELKAGQARLEEGQARHDADIAEIKAGQARHDADIAEVKAGQARHDADIAEIKAGQARHDADIAEIKAGQERHDADIAEVKVGQARHDADIAEIKADITEIKAKFLPFDARKMVGVIADRLNIRRLVWLDNIALLEIADAAGDLADAVPANELQSFYAIDLALRAVGKAERDTQYVVIECSNTVDRNDILRIRRNADLMARFTGCRAHAVVIGNRLPERIASEAETHGVHSFQPGVRVTRAT